MGLECRWSEFLEFVLLLVLSCWLMALFCFCWEGIRYQCRLALVVSLLVLVAGTV